MKKFNRKSLIALLAIAVLIVSSIGVTTAYFSAVSDAQGSAKISLTGKTTIDEGEDKTKKDVTIKNVGESDVLVRVAFFGPEKLEVAASNGWIKGDDGFYYYNKVLEVGKTTPSGALVGSIKLSEKEAAELGTDFTVTVVQECSPVIYKDGKVSTVAGWTLPFTITE